MRYYIKHLEIGHQIRFLTNTNRFVDRYEGFEIAEAQNQLNNIPRASRTLYSDYE